jgi:putative ABC transport system substrate-binding protein
MNAGTTIVLKIRFAVALTIAVLCQPARADDAAPLPRIGVLAAPYASTPANEGLRDGLQALGYIEDLSIVIVRRSGETPDELREAAADLVRSKVDVIAVFSTPAARAATATSLPVVFLVGDPISTGLAASLEQPGGDATGIALVYAELIARRLELLRRLAPQARRIGALMNSSNPASALQFEAARKAAPTLGLELIKMDARDGAQIDTMVRALVQSKVDGILVTGDLLLFANKAKLAGAIREARLPAVFPSREWHGDGELMSYAPSIREAGRKMAAYVDKILKGGKPGELPIEQLSRYELVIDLRVARELGLAIPEDLLLRADEVMR